MGFLRTYFQNQITPCLSLSCTVTFALTWVPVESGEHPVLPSLVRNEAEPMLLALITES